jgi:hypothetical protein
VLNRQVTKEDLLALCLGCESCKGVWLTSNGTIVVPINKVNYWLRSFNCSTKPLEFYSDGLYDNAVESKINNIEELKKAMRHHWYGYSV